MKFKEYLDEMAVDTNAVKIDSIIKDKRGDEWTVISMDDKGVILKANDDGSKYFVSWENLRTYGADIIKESR